MARTYRHRFETTAEVNSTPEVLFDELDDHERLSAHMMKSSSMMAGSKMDIGFDEAGGRAVGSKIRMSGRMLGFQLELKEVVTERDRPLKKVWETVGQPHLLVIGDYRMGFEVQPLGRKSKLLVFIEYDDPGAPWTIFGRLLGPVYARWCTASMAEGAARHFAK